MWRTLADIFALRVDASAILTGLWAFALVHIGAVATGTIQLVTFVALAAEHAEDILAMAEHAQITEHIALVDVYAGLLVMLVRMHEAHFALAAISARIVQAMSVLAERDVLRTLVDILAAVAVAPETGIAYALQKSLL